MTILSPTPASACSGTRRPPGLRQIVLVISAHPQTSCRISAIETHRARLTGAVYTAARSPCASYHPRRPRGGVIDSQPNGTHDSMKRTTSHRTAGSAGQGCASPGFSRRARLPRQGTGGIPRGTAPRLQPTAGGRGARRPTRRPSRRTSGVRDVFDHRAAAVAGAHASVNSSSLVIPTTTHCGGALRARARRAGRNLSTSREIKLSPMPPRCA